MIENERFLKEKEQTQKCENHEKVNEVLKQKCLVECNELISKYKTIQELQKEYDGMKLFEGIQKVLNNYIDEVAKLKQELAEKEKLVNKLQSYHTSSYILERIFNITPDGDDSEKNQKGIGSEYHQVPPPLKDNYTFYDSEKMEKAINMVDQLPDNIDVTYSKSDDLDDSEVLGKVVESVLSEESIKTDKSES
ncbi:hypothetical protein Hanom_Chr02g00126941 [Helianthus anomalus]